MDNTSPKINNVDDDILVGVAEVRLFGFSLSLHLFDVNGNEIRTVTRDLHPEYKPILQALDKWEVKHEGSVEVYTRPVTIPTLQDQIAELKKLLATAEAMRDYYKQKTLAGDRLAGGVSMALEMSLRPSHPAHKGLTEALKRYDEAKSPHSKP